MYFCVEVSPHECFHLGWNGGKEFAQHTSGPKVLRCDMAVAQPDARVSRPVYAMASRGLDGRATMNVVTFAAPVAIQPRTYAVGLYLDTLTWDNVRRTRKGALQLLRKRHAELLPLLGKQSGRDVDKYAELEARGFATKETYGLQVLADSYAVLDLQVVGDVLPCGDHDLAICRVLHETWISGDEEDVLYTKDLKMAGYL